MIPVSQIDAAAEVLRGFIRHTPVMTSPTITGLCEPDQSFPTPGRVILKAENLQKTGSFKIRGAYYRLSLLSEAEKERGVVCASAGNHAQGVALAAKQLGIKAVVFMPETAAIAKIRGTKNYGAEVHLEGRNYDEAVIAAKAYEKRRQAVFISAYDDDAIIAGQGTLGRELLNDQPDLDTIIIPIGGGGLFAGVAHAIKSHKPDVKIIGVQAEGADTAVRSFHSHQLLQRPEPVTTICDGIAVKAPSERTFEYIQAYADEMVTVSDASVATALLLLVERLKLVVEPSGAAALAALLSKTVKLRGKTGVLLCGGNIDLKLLSDLIDRELLKQHRYVHLLTSVEDKPGTLAKLLETVANQKGNIISVHHDRLSPSVPLGSTGVEILFEARDEEHRRQVIYALRMQGYPVKVLD
jgi:threonine dehydratase